MAPQRLYRGVEEEMTLRDRLALHRTLLANKRTWLAAARTALALFVTGASFLHFFESTVFEIIGWTFIVLSLPVLGAGWVRYLKEQRTLRAIVERQPPAVTGAGGSERLEATTPAHGATDRASSG